MAWLVWMGPRLEVVGALWLSCSWPAVVPWLPRSRGAGNVVFVLIGQLDRVEVCWRSRQGAGASCPPPSHAGRIGLLGHPRGLSLLVPPGGQHPLSGSAVCSNTEYKHFPFVSFFCFGYIFNYKSRTWLLYSDRCLHAWGAPWGGGLGLLSDSQPPALSLAGGKGPSSTVGTSKSVSQRVPCFPGFRVTYSEKVPSLP